MGFIISFNPLRSYLFIVILFSLVIFHTERVKAGSEFVRDLGFYNKWSCMAGTGIPPFLGQPKPLWKRHTQQIWRDEFSTCCDVLTYFPVAIESIRFSSVGDDTTYGINDTIVIRLKSSAHQLIEHGVPWNVTKYQIDDWFQATSETSLPDRMERVNLGLAYDGVWNDTKTLIITIKDVTGASKSLFKSGPPNLHFRINGNLSDAVSGNVYLHNPTSNTSSVETNTIDCGDENTPAGSKCRLNLTTLPTPTQSTSSTYKILNREGRFGKFHIQAAFLSKATNNYYSSSSNFSCNRKDIVLNLVLSRPVKYYANISLNLTNSINTLFQFQTLKEKRLTHSSSIILKQYVKQDLLVNMPFHKSPLGYFSVSDIGEWNEIYAGNSPLGYLGVSDSFQSVAFGDRNGDEIDDFALLNIGNDIYRFEFDEDQNRFQNKGIWKAESDCSNCTVGIGSIAGVNRTEQDFEDSFLIVLGKPNGELEFYNGYTNPDLLRSTVADTIYPNPHITITDLYQQPSETKILHILVAHSNNWLRYFQYTPSTKGIEEIKKDSNMFFKFNHTFIRTPTFIDIDRDGDIDIISNKDPEDLSSEKHFAIYENYGTASEPFFVYSPEHIALKASGSINEQFPPGKIIPNRVRTGYQSVAQFIELDEQMFNDNGGFLDKLNIRVLETLTKHLAPDGDGNIPLAYAGYKTIMIQNLHILLRETKVVTLFDISPIDYSIDYPVDECPPLEMTHFRILFNAPVYDYLSNKELVFNETEIKSLWTFNRNIGTNFSGRWTDDATFQIEITATDGQDFDVVGKLSATYNEMNNLATFESCLAISPITENQKKPFIPFRTSSNIIRFEAIAHNCSYGAGSKFVITFQGGLDIENVTENVNGELDLVTENVNVNKTEIDKFLQFSPSLGSKYTGKWKTDFIDGLTYYALTIEIIDATGGPTSTAGNHDEFINLRGIIRNQSLSYRIVNSTVCTYINGATPALTGTFSKIPQIEKVTIFANTNEDMAWGKGIVIEIDVSAKTDNEIGKQDLTKAESLKYFVPSVDLGAAYFGTWNRYTRYRIEITDPTGNMNPLPGTLYFNATSNVYGELIKDSNGNITGPGICPSDQIESLPLFPRVYATGSFMGPNRIVSAVAKDGCTPRSYGVGDRIVVTLAQSSMQSITGLPALYRGDPGCQDIFDINNDLSIKRKYKCLKMVIYQHLKLSYGFKAVCIGYMAWMKWTTPKTFEILIEDPRDDCSGFDGIDLIPGALDHNWQEIALQEVTSNKYPPQVIGDVNGVHTSLIVKDTGVTDLLFATTFELQPIFSGNAKSTCFLTGEFTGAFGITFPTKEHVIIDLKVLYSILNIKVKLQGNGFLIYKPRIRATDLLIYESDITRCCGAGNENTKKEDYPGYRGCCEDTVMSTNPVYFESDTPKMILCMKGLDCPAELIPYVMATTNQAGNTVLNSNCFDTSATCLLQKEGTTYFQTNIIFQQNSFGLTRMIDPETELPIQDKLGGAMMVHLYHPLAGEFSTILATIGWIEELAPLAADAGVETLITIKGVDFDNKWKKGGYQCHFYDEVGNKEVTNASVFNTTRMTCLTPIWLYKAKVVTVQVSRFGVTLQTGFCDEKVCKTTNALLTRIKLLNLTFYETWTQTLIQNTSVNGGITVVEGNGFNMSSREYRCRMQFTNKSLYYVVSPPAFPVSSTRILCLMPKWPFHIVQSTLMLYQHGKPVLRRDSSYQQKHSIFGSCKQENDMAVAFVFSFAVTINGFVPNTLMVKLKIENDYGDTIYVDNTVGTDANYLSKLLKSLIRESDIDRDNLAVSITYNVTDLPEGITYTWWATFSTSAPILIIPKFKVYKHSLFNYDGSKLQIVSEKYDYKIQQFIFNGIHWPTACIACDPSLYSGWDYTCARSADSRIKCWGDNMQRQLYPEYDPVVLPDQKSWINYKDISWKNFRLGYSHTCGVQDVTGLAVCYGLAYPGLQIKIEAPSDLRFSSISPGAYHTCAVTVEGKLSCWGEQLLSKATPPNSFCHRKESGMMSANAKFVDSKLLACTEKPDIKESPYIHTASSVSHNCAIESDDNSLLCWGDNSGMQLGTSNCNGTMLDETERTCAVTIGPFADVALGIQHTCGLFMDGTIDCWGIGMQNSPTPANVKFRSVTSGHRHACGIANDESRVYCWGANVKGQSNAPEDTGYVEVSAGSQHTCALKVFNDKKIHANKVEKVVCWGNYNNRKLKIGKPTFAGYDGEHDPGYVTQINDETTSIGATYASMCFPKTPKEACTFNTQIQQPVHRRCYQVLGCGNTFSQVLPHIEYIDKWKKMKEVQTIKLINAIGGTFTVTFGNETTVDLSFNDTAKNVESALQQLTNIGKAGVNVVCARGSASFEEECTKSEWRVEFNHYGQRKGILYVNDTDLKNSDTANGGVCYKTGNGTIQQSGSNRLSCDSNSAEFGRDHSKFLNSIYYNNFAADTKLNGILYCITFTHEEALTGIRGYIRTVALGSSAPMQYAGDKRWNMEWNSTIHLHTTNSSFFNTRLTLQTTLQKYFQNSKIRVLARNDTFCIDLRASDAVVYFGNRDALEIKTVHANCTSNVENVEESKISLTEYRKRLLLRQTENRQYFSHASFFTLMILIMTSLASFSWSETILLETNKDNLDKNTLISASTNKKKEDSDEDGDTTSSDEFYYSSDSSDG